MHLAQDPDFCNYGESSITNKLVNPRLLPTNFQSGNIPHLSLLASSPGSRSSGPYQTLLFSRNLVSMPSSSFVCSRCPSSPVWLEPPLLGLFCFQSTQLAVSPHHSNRPDRLVLTSVSAGGAQQLNILAMGNIGVGNKQTFRYFAHVGCAYLFFGTNPIPDLHSTNP
jgi:hypothetical protein